MTKPEHESAKKPQVVQICEGTTAKGKPCKRKAIGGTTFCAAHTDGMNKGGRPSEYDEAKHVAGALLSVANGATWSAIARQCGITEETAQDWCNPESPRYHPEFSGAVTRARETCDDNAVTGLYRRATGYDYTEEYTETRRFLPKPADLKKLGDEKDRFLDDEGMLNEVIERKSTHHIPADVGAAKMWLPNRRPSEWRDASKIEVTGKDGAALTLAVIMGEVAERE